MSHPPYTVEFELRQRWAWAVLINRGKTVARCDSEKSAQLVARAMNMALAVSKAAAERVQS